MKYFRYLVLYLLIVFNNQAYADIMLDLGKKIFYNKGNCSSCHLLSDSISNGKVNLKKIKPSKEMVIDAVTNGVGGGMPSYDGVLSSVEIESVSNYVYYITK